MTGLGRWLSASCVALFVAATPAVAAQKPISGKLSKRGYTVIALDHSGRARVANARPAFKLRPTARKVTLHLRDAKGKYAGPVVVARKDKRVILGVKAGARLGYTRVKKGYAVVAKPLAKTARDGKVQAQARSGRPIGARVFGRVKSKLRGSSGPGNDLDLDGIPGAFDVDDDGDLILDNVDASSAAAQAGQAPPPGEAPGGGQEAPGPSPIFSNFHLDLIDSVNANAGTVSDAQVDAQMTAAGRFVGLAFQKPDDAEVELDCGGLVYCSAGGTGRSGDPTPDGGGGAPFPECCDADGDGFGSISGNSQGNYFQLRTRASSSQIGAGDTIIEHVTRDGVETLVPVTIQYVFNTTPALISWHDSAGNGGEIAYPVPAGAPGTRENPFKVAPGPDGHVMATLAFWRPQRRPIAGSGEGSDFVDAGGLRYALLFPNAPGNDAGTPPQTCAPSLYSGLSGGLAPGQGVGLVDTEPDTPSNSARRMSFTLDITACLASHGTTWEPGQWLGSEINASSVAVNDVSAQGLAWCLPNNSGTCPGQQAPPPGGSTEPPPGP